MPKFSVALTLAVLTTALAAPSPARAQQTTIDFESIMDTYFDDTTGLISFQTNIVAFAPDGPFAGQVAVLDPKGKIVAHFNYFDTINREGVFGNVQVQGPADVQLTEPGIYTLVYLVAGKPVTRMPVRLLKTTSDDPFNPKPTYRFDGYWRTLAHITQGSYKDQPTAELNFWVGGIDLPVGKTKDMFFVELIRDGKVVAHSKRTQGFIAPGHFKRTRISLYHPHDEKHAANAELFMLSDWRVNGSYEVKVTRKSDGKMIRSFDFDVAEGKFVPLAETDLGYEPHVDHILPRVMKKGSTTFEMVPTTWIRDGGNR